MSGEPELHVHLRTPEGGEYGGRCIDLESSLHEILASVEFRPDQAPTLRVGGTIELEFRGGGLGSLMRAEALTVLRTDDPARRCYCFRGKLTKRALHTLANRRRSQRIRPRASDPVRVRILDLGEEAPEVLLHDTSATGLAVLVEPTHEQQLCTRERLRLAIRLPGEERAVEFSTTVRHRRLVGSAILYGLEIDGQIPELMRADNRFWVYVSNLRSQDFGAHG
jgi:hypothetical protein